MHNFVQTLLNLENIGIISTLNNTLSDKGGQNYSADKILSTEMLFKIDGSLVSWFNFPLLPLYLEMLSTPPLHCFGID